MQKPDKEKQAKEVVGAEEEQEHVVKKARVEQVGEFEEEAGEHHHHHHESQKQKSKGYHFFKIISQDKHIELPKEFVSKFRNEFGDVVFAVVPNGKMWRVELKKTKTKIWFENGWDEFMDYYSINVGQLLVFGYNGNSLFRVTVFDTSATEIEYSICGANKDRKFNYMESNQESICHKSLSDAVEESGDSVEIIDNARNSFSEQSTYQFEGSALEAAKAFKSQNPVCMIVMRRTSLDKGPVNVPTGFARKYLIGKTRSVILSVKQRTWSVCFYPAPGKCYGRLHKGWIKFASDNHLKDGDVCIFELVHKKSFRIEVHVLRVSYQMS